jgi:hypothetical protein
MKLREKRERLMVGLYLAAQEKGFTSYIDLRTVAERIALERRAGELRTIAYSLRDTGYIDEAFSMGGDEQGLQMSLTAAGIEAAEDLLDEHPEYELPVPQHVPAADRYVGLSDNQRSDVLPQLGALRDAVSASNEASEEDRLVALSEIAAFESTILQHRVATELIERFARKVLAWLTRTFGDALVGGVAGILVERLLLLAAGG